MPRRLTLTSARSLLVTLGVGERSLPSATVAPPAARDTRAVRQSDLEPPQRRLAVNLTRSARVGPLRWSDTLVAQSTGETCGSAVLVVLAALGDPVLAAWLLTGRRIGSVPPPELALLSSEELEAPDVAARLAVAERRFFARSRDRALGPFTWPARWGTPPWALARHARYPGVTYRHTPVNDRDVAQTRAILQSVKAATRAGIPVPLYSGGDLAGSPAAALPRHVILALPWRRDTPSLRIYEPGSGRIREVTLDSLLARERTMAALGNWTHLVWAVLPESAFRETDGGSGSQSRTE